MDAEVALLEADRAVTNPVEIAVVAEPCDGVLVSTFSPVTTTVMLLLASSPYSTTVFTLVVTDPPGAVEVAVVT